MFSAARDKRNCFDKKCEYISSINSTHSYMLDAAVNMLLSGRLMLGESKFMYQSHSTVTRRWEEWVCQRGWTLNNGWIHLKSSSLQRDSTGAPSYAKPPSEWVVFFLLLLIVESFSLDCKCTQSCNRHHLIPQRFCSRKTQRNVTIFIPGVL